MYFGNGEAILLSALLCDPSGERSLKIIFVSSVRSLRALEEWYHSADVPSGHQNNRTSLINGGFVIYRWVCSHYGDDR